MCTAGFGEDIELPPEEWGRGASPANVASFSNPSQAAWRRAGPGTGQTLDSGLTQAITSCPSGLEHPARPLCSQPPLLGREVSNSPAEIQLTKLTPTQRSKSAQTK